MSATAENAARNMRTLQGNVMVRLNLPADDNSWTQDQRISYLKEMAREVVRLAESFTPEQVAQAQIVLAKQYQSLEDTSIEWGTFAAEVGVNFGNFTKLLVAAAVVGVVVYALWKNKASVPSVA